MVGMMTKDDDTRLTVKHCQSSTISSSSSSVSGEDDHGIAELQRMIRKAWSENPQVAGAGAAITSSTSGIPHSEEKEPPSANQLLEKMLGDEAQLERILIARKYEMEACVSLFFEQFRFRAKWKPQSIQPEDIPNALPCKYKKKLNRLCQEPI